MYTPAAKFVEEDVWGGFPSENDWFGGWAKRIGELQAEAYRIQQEWDVVKVVRPANVYGAYDNFDPKGSMVIPSLVRKAHEATSDLSVLGDGSPVRDFVHASDVAAACLFVLEEDVKKPMNVGSGTGHSIRELAETVIDVSGKNLQINWSESTTSGDNVRIMDMSFANSLGFSAKVGLHSGLLSTYNWFAENEDNVALRFDAFK